MFEGGSTSGTGTVTGADVAAVTVQNEVPGGPINGVNTAFTTAFPFIAGTLQVYLNGDLQESGGNDYTEGVSGFTMVLAPKTLDKLLVSYIKSP
jgi:hypothetical protein